MPCLLPNIKKRPMLECKLEGRGQDTRELHVEEIVNQSLKQGQGVATNNTGQQEHHELIIPLEQ